MKTLLALSLFAIQSIISPISEPPPIVVTHRELFERMEQSLHTEFPETIRDFLLFGPEDTLYIAPTEHDIKQLLKFYRPRRSGLEYLDQAWDCDNFAREFKYWADVWSTRYYSYTPSALAVGMAYVKLEGDLSDIFPGHHEYSPVVYHVLIVIMRNDGQWLWYEPQSGALVPVESMLYEGSAEIIKVNL